MFVINGADYELVHGGSGRLYSTAQTFEAVNGVIRNGAHGRFDVDIPPYSSQAFVSRMKVANDSLGVKLQEIAGDKQVTKLVLSTGPDFPPPGNTAVAYAVCGDRVYPLRWSTGRFELDHSGELLSAGRSAELPPALRSGEPLSVFLASVDWNKLSPYGMGNMRFSPFMRRPTSPRPTSRSTRLSFGHSWPGASVSSSVTTFRPFGFPMRRFGSFSGRRFPKASNSSGLTWASSRDAFCTCSILPNR